jgi:hypothetical protein
MSGCHAAMPGSYALKNEMNIEITKKKNIKLTKILIMKSALSSIGIAFIWYDMISSIDYRGRQIIMTVDSTCIFSPVPP